MGLLIVNTGEVAHLTSGDTNAPLTGADMIDRESNTLPTGQAILIRDSVIERICDSESLISEFAPWWQPDQGSVGVSDTPSDASTSLSTSPSVLDGKGNAVIPGFVDCHTHLLWGGDRSNEVVLREQGYSYREIAEMGGGIGKTVRSTRNMPLDDMCRIGLKRLNKMISTGTTVIEAKSGYGLELEAELRMLEAMKRMDESSNAKIFPTWLGAHDFPSERSRSEYMDHLLSTQLPAVAEQGIARWADVFCEVGWFTNEETEDIVRAASEFNIPSRLHVDEFEDSGGLALAAELDAVSGDHAAKSTDASRQAATDTGTMQTFLPGTPYVLGKPLDLPLQKCVERGWAFSLATDYNPNCEITSIPFIGNLATSRMDLDPFATLIACTRNPSTTLGDAEITGTIEEGGRADLNILNSQSVDAWCQTPEENQIMSTILSGSIVKQSK
ncbi:uncharacterized protein METZ01_LOCUS150881 [marine metagenome]|uniref:imidazolonepropionase n=1 Tax=marine metagenome TaxID=408172 RepID=A0A382AAG2_9ZZZZ